MAEVPEDVPDVGVYAGDSTGRLKVLHTNPKAYEQVDIQGWQYGPAVACQELVYGSLSLADGANVSVVCVWLCNELTPSWLWHGRMELWT